MKYHLIIVFCIILFLPTTKAQNKHLFYYAGNNKYSLTIVPHKRAILRQATPTDNKENFAERIGARININDLERNLNDSQYADRILLTESGDLSLPVYSVNNGTETILLPQIVLKPRIEFFNNMSHIVNMYHLELIKDTHNYQIYSVPIDCNVIGVANEIFETGYVDFAYPNLFCSAEASAHIPNDQYFLFQIACHNIGQVMYNGHTGTIDADINAPEAWEITKGSYDIVIAVIDAGVTNEHPDLPMWRQQRLFGSNFGTGNPDNPSPTGNDNHGNACAGVIAATMDNNEGIAGIAPLCRIMPIRFDNTSSPNDMADAIHFAVNNGANIISCSWGYSDSGGAYNLFPVITNAIDSAIANNVVVLFSAGNTANHVAGNNDGYVTFPANANIPNLITVGASDRYDQIANYSPISYSIDFVAPSHRAYSRQISTETFEMWTIDIPGPSGYNPIPYDLDSALIEGIEIPRNGTNRRAYTGCFGGTSHSCPVVAGVVALMLSVNPDLTPPEIFKLLKESSAKVGGYTYIDGRCDEMGYGRIDAYEAVVAARDIQYNKYIQDTTYINGTTCAEYSKELYAGYAVTDSKPYGDVVIQAGSDVLFIARNQIELHPGFRVEQGATFKTVIETPSQQAPPSSSYVGMRERNITETIEEQHNLDISQQQRGTIAISPNPVSSFLHIQATEELSQIKVYTVNGQCVLQSAQTDIDVSSLPQGMYILQAMTHDGLRHQAKFIKQ